MNSLTIPPLSSFLEGLFEKASIADRPLGFENLDFSEEQMREFLAEEAKDYQSTYRDFSKHYLNVSPQFGRFLYMCARARGARRIVEFGTSFGISAIHLACALRDNGGGQFIGTEIEASKAVAARENLSEAGLGDLVEIRAGDALETLEPGVGGGIDLVHLDGAFHLYLPVLKLLEPHLKPGALVVGENAIEPSYIDYIRNPENGYLSVPMPWEPGRGNEFAVFTGKP